VEGVRIGDERRFVNLVDLVTDDDLLNATVGLRHKAKTMRTIRKFIIAGVGRRTEGGAGGKVPAMTMTVGQFLYL
jgi:hypothetical protein